MSATAAVTHEFIETGIPELLDSEDLCDKLLDIFMSLLADGWQGERYGKEIEQSICDLSGIARIYRDGLWLPCVSRIALRDQIDTRNDDLPDYAAVPWMQEDGGFEFISVQRIERPKRWSVVTGNVPPKAYYRITTVFNRAPPGRDTRHHLLMRDKKAPIVPTVRNALCAVVGDRIVPCQLNGRRDPASHHAGIAFNVSATLGIVTDFKHLWNVETSETVYAADIPTPLRLGVAAEQVKSLFYARSLPVTESGRKRPILHWVRAHQRRLADGIDIDITKHLRGISVFDMGGFAFQITSPIKRTAK